MTNPSCLQSVKPALEIQLGTDSGRARYALEELLTLVGYPFRFVNDWHQPAVRIGYSTLPDYITLDIHIPESEAAWTTSRLNHGYVDNIPVITPGQLPESLVRDGQFTVDIVRATFELLSRREEKGVTDFRAYQSFLYKRELHTVPVVSHFAERLRILIDQYIDHRSDSLERASPWGEAEFAVVLSHDLDHVAYYRAGLALRYLWDAMMGDYSLTGRLEGLSRGVLQCLGVCRSAFGSDEAMSHVERYLALEERHDVRSTFFVGGAPETPLLSETDGRRIPEPQYSLSTEVEFEGSKVSVAKMLATLSERGWEIALHGSSESYRNVDRLRIEKDELEHAIGSPVEGNRQHYLRFSMPKSWTVQEQAGITYDSTIGYNDCLGHRAGIAAPFRPYDFEQEQPRSLLEIPMTVHDVVPVQKESLPIKEAVKQSKQVLEHVRRIGGLATLSWHPTLNVTQDWQRSFQIYERLLKWLDDQNVLISTANKATKLWKNHRQQLHVE